MTITVEAAVTAASIEVGVTILTTLAVGVVTVAVFEGRVELLAVTFCIPGPDTMSTPAVLGAPLLSAF